MIKALIVGINAYPTAPLRGCINDAMDVIGYLTRTQVFSSAEVLPLFDARATKGAIVQALQDLISASSPGDHLFFHFSGHGAQLPSRLGEGLDEVLCPFDFTWGDPSTALTVEELRAVLATVPAGRALTVVVDAGHASQPAPGAGTPRCLVPPPDIALVLMDRKRSLRTRALTHLNAAVVWACGASEVTVDASFEGRANGAFTRHWLAELGAFPQRSLEAHVKAVATSAMHPELEGPPELRSLTFLADVPANRSLIPVRTARVPAQVVFDREWCVRVLDQPVRVSLRMVNQAGNLTFTVTNQSLVPLSWSFGVDGPTTEQIDLGYGFRLLLDVSEWVMTSKEIAFELSLQVAPPFFYAVSLVQERVAVPRLRAERTFGVPASLAELLALIELAHDGAGPGPLYHPVSSARAEAEAVAMGPGVKVRFAGGLFGDRFSARARFDLPEGYARHHVEVVLEPAGSANVSFVRWCEDDETNADFEFHVGVAACMHGTATFKMFARPIVMLDQNTVGQFEPLAAPHEGNAALELSDTAASRRTLASPGRPSRPSPARHPFANEPFEGDRF